MRLAWHELSFDIPDDWEATRYSIASPSGRFEFSNRHGPLGRVSWEHVKRQPDRERTLTEFHRRFLADQKDVVSMAAAGLKTKRVGVFQLGYRHDGEPCQAITYLKEASLVIMWVFPEFSEKLLETVWVPILESFEPNNASWREWGAFGIHCRLPKDFDIEEAKIRPADAWVAFQHPNMHRIDLHRWGLPRELLRNGSLSAFASRILRGSGIRVVESRETEWLRMPSINAEIEVRGTRGMDKLFAAHWRGQARFWHNELEKRIYASIQAAPRKVQLLEVEEVFSV